MICFSDGSITLSSRGNVSVTVIRAPLKVEQLHNLRREVTRFQEAYGTARVSLAIVEPAAMVPPEDEVRAEAAAIPRDLPTMLDATVLEGAGFRAAAVRAVMNGLTFVTGRGATRRTFATVEAAIEALVATKCVTLSRDDVRALVAEARGNA